MIERLPRKRWLFMTRSGIALIAKRITLFSRHFRRQRRISRARKLIFIGERKRTFVLCIELTCADGLIIALTNPTSASGNGFRSDSLKARVERDQGDTLGYSRAGQGVRGDEKWLLHL